MLKTEQFYCMYRLMNPHWSLTHNSKFVRERSDLMVEYLTRDRRVTGSSLTGGTAAVVSLSKIYKSLLSTVSTQGDQPDMTQNAKNQFQINKIRLTHTQRRTEIIFLTLFIAKLKCRFYYLN